jgi:UDP-glucose 4-epimerase
MTLHCVVIGGTGFIGQYLIRHLASTERNVTVVGRKAQPPNTFPLGIEYVQGGLGHPTHVQLLLEKAEEIVDLSYSTVPKSSFDDPISDLDQNVRPVVTLLQAAARNPRLRKMVIVSSGGTVYGQALHTPITENHPTNPISPYGITKLAIEKYGLMYHYLHGLPIVIVRPSNAYGEGQLPFRGQGLIATVIASIQSGQLLKLYGGRETFRDYIHVNDVATAITALLDQGIPGNCYNVATGLGTSSIDIVQNIAALAVHEGFQPEWIDVPARPFDVRTNVLDFSLLASTAGWYPAVKLSDGLSQTWHSRADSLDPRM